MFLSLANSWRWSRPWGWDQGRSFWQRLPLHMAQILQQSRELSAWELGLGGRGPRRHRPPGQPHSEQGKVRDREEPREGSGGRTRKGQPAIWRGEQVWGPRTSGRGTVCVHAQTAPMSSVRAQRTGRSAGAWCPLGRDVPPLLRLRISHARKGLA